MGILVAIMLLALGLWSIISTYRRLRRIHAKRAWWVASSALAFCGLMAGCWLAFKLEYQPSATSRVFSSPMPLAFFHFENEHWVDFVLPAEVKYTGLLANVVAIVALALLPITLASLRRERRHR